MRLIVNVSVEMSMECWLYAATLVRLSQRVVEALDVMGLAR